MYNKNILVSGKGFSRYPNACERVRSHMRTQGFGVTYQLTTYHDTLNLTGLTTGQKL